MHHENNASEPWLVATTRVWVVYLPRRRSIGRKLSGTAPAEVIAF